MYYNDACNNLFNELIDLQYPQYILDNIIDKFNEKNIIQNNVDNTNNLNNINNINNNNQPRRPANYDIRNLFLLMFFLLVVIPTIYISVKD